MGRGNYIFQLAGKIFPGVPFSQYSRHQSTFQQVNLLPLGWSNPCSDWGRGEVRWGWGGRRTLLSLSDHFALFISPGLQPSSGSDKAECCPEGTCPSGGGNVDEKRASTQRLIALQWTHPCRCFHTHPDVPIQCVGQETQTGVPEEEHWYFVFLGQLPGKAPPSWVFSPTWFYSSPGGTSWITINSHL